MFSFVPCVYFSYFKPEDEQQPSLLSVPQANVESRTPSPTRSYQQEDEEDDKDELPEYRPMNLVINFVTMPFTFYFVYLQACFFSPGSLIEDIFTDTR